MATMNVLRRTLGYLAHDDPQHPRVAIYARQSVEEDQGIRQQVQECQDHASRRQWPVVAVFDRDNDVSASKDRGVKTDWVRMLKAFDNGDFDTLMLTETSRLTRSLSDVLDVTAPRRDMRVEDLGVQGGRLTLDGNAAGGVEGHFYPAGSAGADDVLAWYQENCGMSLD